MDDFTKDMLKKMGFREDYDIENKFILKTDVYHNGIKYMVSTVDLGLDHNYGGPRPLYYETMIFRYRDNESDIDYGGIYQNRYTTKAEAMVHHEYLVNAFKVGDVKIENGELTL